MSIAYFRSRLDTTQKSYDYGSPLGVFFREVNRNTIRSPGMDLNPRTVNLKRVDDVADGMANGVNGIDRTS